MRTDGDRGVAPVISGCDFLTYHHESEREVFRLLGPNRVPKWELDTPSARKRRGKAVL